MKVVQHVNDTQLQTLLYGEEDGSPSTEISRHVEACELCQQRLAHMVSMESSEREVCELLNGFVDTYAERSRNSFMTAGNRAEGELGEYEIAFSKASHPEMLGRLGRYEIERMIGSGGMGVVFKAIDSELNRPVAIKVLAPHLARNGAAKQRFGRESRAAAAVVHEHVVAIHNVESDGETPFIVMQYVSGESLQARVTRLGPLGVQQILRIGIQAASGLAAAHEQGIVHRDVKPANILLEEGVERVLLTDFGLARTVDDASLTHTGVVAGTPHYMSPEQANGDAVDFRSDLFSLGSVLYFVATGHPPFRAERAMGVLNRICHEPHRPAWQVNAELPQELSDVIDRLLEKRPSKRFASALALRDSLTRILQQLQSRSPSITTGFRRWARRNLKATIAIAASVAIFASLFVLFVSALLLQRFSRLLPNRQPYVSSSPYGSLGPTATPDSQTYETDLEYQEIDPKDRSAFTDELRKLHHSLDRFGDSRISQPMEADWRQEIRELNSSLDRLDDRFGPSTVK